MNKTRPIQDADVEQYKTNGNLRFSLFFSSIHCYEYYCDRCEDVSDVSSTRSTGIQVYECIYYRIPVMCIHRKTILS